MPPTESVDKMMSAIREANKPLTTSEVADGSGVTRQTVSRYKDVLKEKPEIQHREMAGANVYWHVSSDVPTSEDDHLIINGEVVESVKTKAEEEGTDERVLSRELLDIGLGRLDDERTGIERVRDWLADAATNTAWLMIFFSIAFLLSPTSDLLYTLMIASFALTIWIFLVWLLAVHLTRRGWEPDPLTKLNWGLIE